MSMENSTKRTLLGGLFFLVAITFVVAIVWIRTSGVKVNTTAAIESSDKGSQKKANCTPSEQFPQLRPKRLNSSTGQLAIQVTGYLELVEEERTRYLPLDFSELLHEKVFDGPSITLNGDCIWLDAKYKLAIEEGSKRYQFQSMDLYLINEHIKIARKFCAVPFDKMLEIPDEHRYSCRQTRSYICARASPDSKPAAYLVLTNFEIEFRPESAPTGQLDAEFIYPAASSGC